MFFQSLFYFIFFNKFILFILFLAALGLRCCMQAFSSCSKQGLPFIAVRGLLIVVASLVAEHRLQARGLQQLWHVGSVVVARGLQSAGSVVVAQALGHAGFSSCGLQALEWRLSSCGTQIQLLHGMWDLPGPGLEPMSPELAGGFLTTAPPGRPSSRLQIQNIVDLENVFSSGLDSQGILAPVFLGSFRKCFQWFRQLSGPKHSRWT